MQNKLPLIAILFALAAAAPARAEEDQSCGAAPKAEWLTEEAIRAKGVALGYEVRRVKVEDGCYELYGVDKNGARAEIYLHPVTGEIVDRKSDD